MVISLLHILVPFILIIYGFSRLLSDSKKDITFLIISFLFIFIVSAFRSSSINPDLETYAFYFTKFRYYSFSAIPIVSGKEILYDYSVWLFAQIFNNFRWYLIFQSAIINYIYYFLIKKYSSYPLVSVLVYIALGIYDVQFALIRQSIAIAICFLIINFILEGDYIKCLLLLIIAMLIHKTSIIFLPIIIVGYLIKEKNFHLDYFVYIIFAIIIYSLRFYIGNFLTYLFNYSEMYYVSTYSIGNKSLMILLVFLISFLFSSVLSKRNTYNSLIELIVYVSFIVQMFSSVSYAFTRLNLYFFQFMILFLPLTLESIDVDILFNVSFSKQVKIRNCIVMVICLMLVLLWFYQIDVKDAMYYKFSILY